MNKIRIFIAKHYLPLSIIIVIILGVGIFFAKKSPEKTSSSPLTPGILVLNTDKSQYQIDNPVLFQMASLDAQGQTLCGSSLKLEISVPGQDWPVVLSTSDKNIVTSSTCSPDNNVTSEPDYIARYKPDKTGNYSIKLTNLDSGKSIDSSFSVYDNPPEILVERTGATRINPFKGNRYSMAIKVTANKDISGQIVELVPGDFQIVWQGPASVRDSDGQAGYKTLAWNVALKAGESKQLAYDYQPPQVSPALFTLGPLTLSGQTKQVDNKSNGSVKSASTSASSVSFSEPHPWLLASDGTFNCTTTTTGTWNWTVTGNWSGCNSTYPGGTGSPDVYNVSINSAGATTVNLNTSVTTIGTLTIGTASSNRTLNFNGFSMTTSGVVTINPSSQNNNTDTINVGTGTLNAGGGIVINGATTGANRNATLSLSSGTINVTGDITFGGTSTRNLSFSGSGTVNLTGNLGSGGTLTASTGTINFNGSSAQTSAGYTFNILKVNNTAGLTMTALSTIPTLTIGDVTSNSVFDDGGFQITSNGTLNLTSGTLKLGSAGTATTFPGFASRNILSGTTVIYQAGVNQTVATTPSYQNLKITPTNNSAVHTVDSGTLSVAGDLTLGTGIHTGTISASNNPTINITGSIDIKSLTVYGKGTGTTTLAGSANSVTISDATAGQDLGAVVIGNGSLAKTVTLSTNAVMQSINITSGSTFDISNKTLTLTGISGTILTKSGNFTISGSTVVFNGDGSPTALTSGAVTLNNLTLSPSISSSGQTYPLGSGALAINGNFLIEPSGTQVLTVNMGADISVASEKTTTISGLGSATSSLVTHPSSSDWDLSTGFLDIDSPGTLDATSSQSQITLTGTTGTLFILDGTFNAGNSTVIFNPDATVALTYGPITFYNLNLTPDNSSSDVYSFGSANLIVNGDFLIQPSGTQLLTLNMSGNITVDPAKTTTITKSSSATSKLVTGGSNPELSTGNLNIASGGTLDGTGSSSVISLTANSTPFTLGGTFTPGSTTFSYTPSATSGVTVTSATYHNLNFDKAGNTFSLTSGGVTCDAGGNLTITNGTLDTVSGSNYPINLGGNWSNSGTFLPQQGTVTMDTSTSPVTISGTTTFYDFKSEVPGKTLKFEAGTTFQFDGVLTLTGTSEPTYVYINSTDPVTPTQWVVNDQGSSTAITYTHITNAGCDGSSKTISLDETNFNGGNNSSCWSFSGGEPSPTPTPSGQQNINLRNGVRFEGGVKF